MMKALYSESISVVVGNHIEDWIVDGNAVHKLSDDGCRARFTASIHHVSEDPFITLN